MPAVLSFVLLLLSSAALGPRPALAQAADCPAVLAEYLSAHTKEAVPYTSDEQMVYFLHVPRTAGRTFHTCLLKLGTPGSRRCPKAYDHLRINMSLPACYLLSSHDDFSVVSLLPDNVAVLTHLRDPVDRWAGTPWGLSTRLHSFA